MKQIPIQSQEQLFTQARTHSHWLEEEISDSTLEKLYELMKWGPTSANCTPVRILFIRTKEAKEKLLPLLAPGNVEKTKSAPVTAILAYDREFFERLPYLFPSSDMKSMYKNNSELAEKVAFRNSSLQIGYFIMAARALGLDCGPMSGFNNQKVDEAFLSDTTWKSNVLCNLGIGDPKKLYPRGPRLSFDEVCRLL